MIYECLIHLPSGTFCGARTREQSRSVKLWGTGEAVFENGEWKGVGDFSISQVDLEPGAIDYPIIVAGVQVMASQVDGRQAWPLS